MLWLVLVYLSWLRFQNLALKPVHHDEAVNGWFTQQVLENGWHHYDPNNYHGPLLFHLFALGEVLGGWGIASLRAVTVAFSVLWLWYLWRFWTRYQWAAKWFVVVLALSPGFLFFSRSAIHEMPFLFFITLTLGGITELVHDQQNRGWRAVIWGSAGMLLLKETWVLFAASLALGGALTWLLLRPRWSWTMLRDQACRWWSPGLSLHIVLAVTLVVLLYTGFFKNPWGLWDLVRTYLPWFKTGVSSAGHDKPLHYWLELLWSYEKPLLFLFIGMTGSVLLFWRSLSFTALWLYLTAVLNLVLYSIIPYKTPWCLLAVFGPLIFAFGMVRTELSAARLKHPLQTAFTLAAFVALIFQWPENEELNFRNPAQPGHPYVYVQTDSRLKQLMDSLEESAQKDPSLYARPIQQGGSESWPMAWALGRFRRQIQQPVEKGIVPDAVLIIMDAKSEAVAASRLSQGGYGSLKFPIRDGREDSVYFLPTPNLPRIEVPSSIRVDER